jgi:lysophospholipase L1-like esterase
MFAGLMVAELALRKVWGFGEMVLFRDDKNFEYIAMPNQERHRFGNRNFYNEYSMRSMPLKSDDSCIVLGFGDSVINGGTLTDQDSLATSIVESQLRLKNGGVRFLNISAGSWGPDNCAGYLKEYGDFNAKMIILMVSSHDAYDNMTFERIAGQHEAYPVKQYRLALTEVILKYIVPRARKVLLNEARADDLMINKNGVGFNKGFEAFKDFVQKSKVPLLVCLHAEKEEVRNKEFNSQGKEILEYCKSNGINLISGLEIGEELKHFRDNIHLNERGQKLWAEVLRKEIEGTITCFK